MRRAAIFAGLLLAARAGAQDIDRSKRPAAPPPPTFKFPKTTSHTLPNGLRLIVAEDHSLPLVAVRAVLAVDSTMDPVGKEGLYALTMAAMREGTTTLSTDQLAERFADIGTAVTPTSFTTTTGSFGEGLTLLGDMLMHPALDDAAIQRRKAAQAATVRRLAQGPAWLPRHLFFALVYGANDGFTRSVFPTEASVNAITRDDVVRLHDEYVRPQLTTLVITGDVTDAAALAAVTKEFGSWPRGAATAPTASDVPATARPTTIYLLDVHSSQPFIYVGDLGPARSSVDYPAADVTASIVGTRMMQTLRERHAFIYSGTAVMNPQRAPKPSTFFSAANVPAPKADSALGVWLSMLKGLRTSEPATTQELDAARNSRVGALPAQTEGPDLLAGRIADLVRDQLPLDYYDRYVARAAALTPADVTTAVAKYLDSDHLVIAVSGDRKVLEPALRAANLAPVVVVDANGNQVP